MGDTIIPHHYHELIEKASIIKNNALPKERELLDAIGFKGLSLGYLRILFYVADYTKSKYLYLDPSFEKVLGYDQQFSMKAGPLFFVSLWHPNDLKIYDREIVPLSTKFLKEQSRNNFCGLAFTFNYRLKTKWGNYLTFMQRSTYFLDRTGTPLAAMGYAVDITDYKTDNKIVFTVESIDQDFNFLSNEKLLKKIYSPDQTTIISKRENEILRFMEKGMSSKQIAEYLYISTNTVNNHRRNMLSKTGCKSSSELISYAVRHGLV